jgi:putative PIN family toxin of toxin-antitoxin system
MRVVIDTNVLLSAALRDRLPEAVVKRVIAADTHEWIVSAEMLLEYEQVLRRPKFGIAAAEVDLWLDTVRAQARTIDVQGSEPFPRDPGDAKIVACARAGNADWLITGDRDLLDTLIAWSGRVLSVGEAAYLLGVAA